MRVRGQPTVPIKPYGDRLSWHDHHDNDIVLAAPVRTPIGKFGGVFSSALGGRPRHGGGGRRARTGGARSRARRPGDLRPWPAGRRRPQHGAADRLPRRRAGRPAGLHGQPGLRLGAPGGPLGGAHHPPRRGAGRPRRRHREHVEHPLLPPPRPLGLPDGERRDRRRHVPGRLQRSALEAGDGRDRRGAGRRDGDRPRRLRRLRPGEPAPLRAGPRRRPLRERDRAGHRSPGRKGETTVDDRRASARRHDPRGDGQARPPSSARGAWSPPATPRGSPTAPRRSSSPRAPRPASSACPSSPGWSAGRWSASIRGSWGSARCPPCASCWRRPGVDQGRDRRGRAQRGLRRPGARLQSGAGASTAPG